MGKALRVPGLLTSGYGHGIAGICMTVLKHAAMAAGPEEEAASLEHALNELQPVAAECLRLASMQQMKI